MNSKRKGNRGEKKVLEILKSTFPEYKFERVFLSGAVNKLGYKNFLLDELNKCGDIWAKDFPYVFEVKYRKEINIESLEKGKLFLKDLLKIEEESKRVGKKFVFVILQNYKNPIYVTLPENLSSNNFILVKEKYALFYNLKDLIIQEKK